MPWSAAQGGGSMALKQITTTAVTSGSGWEAYKNGKIATLIINAPTQTIILPAEYRPIANIQMVVVGLSGQAGRAIINSNSGVVTPSFDGNIYGTVTYPTR